VIAGFAGVRIRIVKPVAGVLDGVSLGHLIPGLTYDLDESLAGYLVSTRSAEAVPESDSSILENTDDALMEHVIRGVTITGSGQQQRERTVGHDRPPGRRKKRR
jgi:hypothetical protein